VSPTTSAKTTPRELISQGAISLFAEQGYASASMSQVAARCQVSKSLLYHYFANKDQLLFECLDAQVKQLQSLLAQAEAEPDAASKLKALVRLFLAEYAHSQAALKVLLNDTHHLPTALAKPLIQGQAKLVKAVTQWIAQLKHCDHKTAHPLAMALFGMMNWTFTWLKPSGDLSYAQYAEVVITTFFEGQLQQ
jgi:AcrR family transcriptional regulator